MMSKISATSPALTLVDAGYLVETAADGAAGLARCEQFSPRIVITDIRMPGMDGIQVLETIKQRFPDTEVIVATAFGEMETAIRALQLDASDFITKPIHTEAMMVALERARPPLFHPPTAQGTTPGIWSKGSPAPPGSWRRRSPFRIGSSKAPWTVSWAVTAAAR